MFKSPEAPAHFSLPLGIAVFLHAGALILAATASARAMPPAALVEYGVELWEQPAPLADPAPEPVVANPAVAPTPLSRPVTTPVVPAMPETPAEPARPAVPALHQTPAAEPALVTDDVEAGGSSDRVPDGPRPDATVAAAPRASSPRDAPAAVVPKATPRSPSGPERQRIAGLLHRRVDSLKRYPAIARRAGWQGVVHLEVTVAPDGRLLGRRIRKSSGVPVLDSDALALIDRASPLRLGDSSPTSPITAVIPVSYVLSN